MKQLISVIGRCQVLFSWGSRQVELYRVILNLIQSIHATGKYLSLDSIEPDKSSLCWILLCRVNKIHRDLKDLWIFYEFNRSNYIF